MLIKKKFRQLKILGIDFIEFLKLKFFSTIELNDKVLYIDFKNPNLYHRFFYLMIKFYEVSGYTIIYPMNFSKFRNLRNGDRYLALMFANAKSFTIKKLPFQPNFIKIQDAQFSADYFKNYFDEQNNLQNSYHVPMSFHPYMYHNNLWNLHVDLYKNRINAIFCYGNFDDQAYLAIKKTHFMVIPRTELLHFFQQRKDYIAIKNREEIVLENQNKSLDKKCVFGIKADYQLEMDDVRVQLSYFNFYLCCPGVVMPLCHNVIEAMSVGTIPIIQKEYAQVMYPNLEDKKNAIIFEDLNQLNSLLDEIIFNLSTTEIEKMRTSVLDYYREYLLPESVVQKINSSLDKKMVYLNAEHRSIKFIK